MAVTIINGCEPQENVFFLLTSMMAENFPSIAGGLLNMGVDI